MNKNYGVKYTFVDSYSEQASGIYTWFRAKFWPILSQPMEDNKEDMFFNLLKICAQKIKQENYFASAQEAIKEFKKIKSEGYTELAPTAKYSKKFYDIYK